MARLRYNFEKGTLGAALTDAETTITFAVAPGFATIVAPDIVAIVIGTEIVHLTAYTAAATTGTIARGREGTTAVAHDSGAAWRHGDTVEDFRRVTSAVKRGSVSVAGSISFAVPWDTLLLGHLPGFDLGGASPEKFIVPEAGVYEFAGGWSMLAANNATRRLVRIRLNGAVSIADAETGTESGIASGIGLVWVESLAANDEVEMLIYQDSTTVNCKAWMSVKQLDG